MKATIILAALGIATASVTAMAGEGGPKGGRLKAADTNGDGLISKAEAAALPRLAENFDAVDTNKDGQVSFDELRAHRQAKGAAHWKKVDANGDGQISKAEAQAGAPRLAEHFDQMDANKDGQLSKDEMKAAHGKGRK